MRTLANMQCTTQCDIDRKQKPGQAEITTRKTEGEKGEVDRGTETNTRTRQGNLIQSKTKLDTDRRWLCVLRSDCDCRCDNATKTQPSDSCGQARGAPTRLVCHCSECNMAKCLRHAQGLRKNNREFMVKGLKEQSE